MRVRGIDMRKTSKRAPYDVDSTLRPWDEVRREFNRRTGENLSLSRVHQIAAEALRKLREGSRRAIG